LVPIQLRSKAAMSKKAVYFDGTTWAQNDKRGGFPGVVSRRFHIALVQPRPALFVYTLSDVILECLRS
jgi:hypothetical protein